MKEYAGVQTIDNLSMRDVFSILGQESDRTDRVRAITELYVNSRGVSSVLQQKIGVTPALFVEQSMASQAGLLEALPHEYELEFSLDANSNGFKDPHLLYRGFFVSQEVLAAARGAFSGGSHNRYVKELGDGFHNIQTAPVAAGKFSHFLFQLQTQPSDFTVLLSNFTYLKSQHDEKEKFGDDATRMLPTPLRYSEGSTVNIADTIRASQESLVASIAAETESVGIVATTSPTPRGKVMLERQGYIPLHLLELPESVADAWRGSDLYQEIITVQDIFEPCYGKLITIPVGS